MVSMKNKLFGFSDARGAARPWSCVIVNMVMMLTGVSCEKMNVGDQSQGDGLEQANVVVRVASFEQIPFPDRTRAVALGDVSTRLNVAVDRPIRVVGSDDTTHGWLRTVLVAFAQHLVIDALGQCLHALFLGLSLQPILVGLYILSLCHNHKQS